MERDVRVVEHAQEGGALGVDAGQQLVEGDEAGLAGEDLVEAGSQLASWSCARLLPPGFELSVEPPDARANGLLDDPLALGEGVEGVDLALHVDPAAGMAADGELPRAVTDEHGVLDQASIA